MPERCARSSSATRIASPSGASDWRAARDRHDPEADQHDPVVEDVPGRGRPGEQEHRADAVEQGDRVDDDARAAQRERPRGPPPAQPLAQRREHHRLERDVDAQHGERGHLRDQAVGPEVDDQTDDHRDRAGDDQRVDRHLAARGHLGEPAVRRHHPVAREREQQAARSGLEAEHAGEEGGHGDDQEDLRADGPERGLQDLRDGVHILTGDDLLQVRSGEHVAAEREERRDAPDEDRHHHGDRDALGRVRHLLRHVAARLEPVEEEQPRERRPEERGEVRAVALHAHRVEEDGELLLALEDQQVEADRDHADELGREADPRHGRQRLGAGEVQRQRHDQQQHGESERDLLGHREAEQAGEEPAAVRRDGGDRHDHRPDVDPRRHPRVPPAPQPPGPRVDAAVDRILRHHLAEDQRDRELPRADDEDPPDRGRPSGRQRGREQRVHAHQRRQVGEAQGEVRPEGHGAVERVLVAEDGEVLAVPELR